MKRILMCSMMVVFLATPAFAAKLYLKEGGVIQAKRVWREGGKVYVLATRDTMTSFEPCEVDSETDVCEEASPGSKERLPQSLRRLRRKRPPRMEQPKLRSQRTRRPAYASPICRSFRKNLPKAWCRPAVPAAPSDKIKMPKNRE